MNNIHPTAIIGSNAKLGNNITVMPYSIIQDGCVIGDDCVIGPQVVIYGGARIGNRVKIHQAAAIANIPQDLKFGNEFSEFIIGDDTVIREYVTLHRGTKETGFSKIGRNCLLMAYSHVAHDTTIGDDCILSNGVQVGGHVLIEDNVIIGGMTPVHQFCKVGQHAMVGGGFRITQDVPPYILTASEPLKYFGLNIIGLRRRGFKSEDIAILKKAYGYMYNPALNISQAKEKILAELGENEYVINILQFIDKSTRGLVGK